MRLIFLGGMLLVASVGVAQKDSTNAKVVDHYIGIQANQLLRQLFNLSNNSSAVVNPYLINYSLNSIRTGWGLNAGIGYTVNSSDVTQGNVTTDAKINSFSFRIGVERKVLLSKKWMVSYGLDLLADKNDNTTTSTTQFSGQTNATEIDLITKDSGFGPRFTLNYYVTPKIILGTEASYYYKAINVHQKTSNTSSGSGGTSSSSDETDQNQKQFNFVTPAIIFLILKF
jgi:hypothetical protein